MSDAVVTAREVRKTFDDEGVLESVDLTVEENEILLLMGPNGVGKSVLLSCLAGSTRPTAGSVDVFGEPATARADTTSFLLQDALCHEKLTGRENIDFYRQLHPAFTDNWQRLVDRFGIDGDLEKPVEDYSGGMTRKLELAIAASIDVPIYLYDEPTAALDLTTIQAVHELFREQQAAEKTLVVASHRPMDADVANRIAFLAEDGIVATGRPDDLLASLPPILETGTANTSALTEAIEGEPYAVAGNVRGFLGRGHGGDNRDTDAGGRDADALVADAAVATGIGIDDLTLVEPTYTDLFNYYTESGPQRDEGFR
ncbi:ATP-binding cassette domain-containing protein [Natronorubrum sp. A-ect3]|uniref:ATP-binding cassette domain-containing protein n=1 Tax=Natronorubrum sp. A-ect3 TaxID=3242698 RepID=UPI00359E97C1